MEIIWIPDSKFKEILEQWKGNQKKKKKRYRTETGHFDQKGNKNILIIIRTDIENLAFHFHITLSQLSKHPYLILITFQQKALKFCSKNANKLSSSFNRSTKFTCNRSIPRSDQTLTKKCSQRKKLISTQPHLPGPPNIQKTIHLSRIQVPTFSKKQKTISRIPRRIVSTNPPNSTTKHWKKNMYIS